VLLLVLLGYIYSAKTTWCSRYASSQSLWQIRIE